MDEKTENVNDQRICGNRRIIRHGRETHGGICKKIAPISRRGNNFATFNRFAQNHKRWALWKRGFGYAPYNWTEEYFKNFPETAEDFEPGYGRNHFFIKIFPKKSKFSVKNIQINFSN